MKSKNAQLEQYLQSLHSHIDKIKADREFFPKTNDGRVKLIQRAAYYCKEGISESGKNHPHYSNIYNLSTLSSFVLIAFILKFLPSLRYSSVLERFTLVDFECRDAGLFIIFLQSLIFENNNNNNNNNIPHNNHNNNTYNTNTNSNINNINNNSTNNNNNNNYNDDSECNIKILVLYQILMFVLRAVNPCVVSPLSLMAQAIDLLNESGNA